ncbi:hypothetical protein B0T18DRAFT_400471 [Schizothecium vesticola]|uniref:F-box domain-containing protein n=1 Tax=Schizothecium vesticola TaxID=314040 RepID=A0AA40FCB0_9PEZI|nr:hypothetical protein B0T18DRAFT_400471 [Schizothecium vesticola]
MEHTPDRQDHLGRPHILDLPDELLCDIFDYFRPDDVDVTNTPYSYLFDEETRDAGDDALAALQNARLVCRRFHDLASPLLVPVLRASIDSESLRRIDGLTRNPHVASGVRLVQLLLGYRPRDVAQSIVRYRELQSRKIHQLCLNCDRYLEFPDPDDEFTRAMMAAVERYSYMLSAWDECSDRGDSDGNGEDGTDDTSTFKKLLYECHDEYRRRQEDQDRLLADGSYAAALAASAGRMTGLRALSFSDHMYRPTYGLVRDVLARPAHDAAKLREMMVMPQDWATIEGMSPVPTLLAARLLWEVPVALFENGVRLQEVAVSTLPRGSNLGLLGQPAWDRLRAAVRGLLRVDVGRLHKHSSSLPAVEKTYIDRYLDALLSGESLQQMDLDASALYPDSDDDTKYAIGSVLASACHPNLRELHLDGVSFLQHEMEAFIGGLGGALRSVDFYDVGIRDGTWENSLELLRDKIALSRRPVEVALVGLHGQGMDSPAHSQAHDSSDSDSDSDSNDEGHSGGGERDRKESLFRDMERYIRGEEGMANPLSQR